MHHGGSGHCSPSHLSGQRFDDGTFSRKAELPDLGMLRAARPFAEPPKSHRDALSDGQVRAVHYLDMHVRLGRIARVAAVRDRPAYRHLLTENNPNGAGLQMHESTNTPLSRSAMIR